MSLNTGGRVNFTKGNVARIINMDGTISNEDYIIDQDRSDRRGQLQLIHKLSGNIKKIHHRRILPHDYCEGQAVVLEVGSRYHALCPKCGSSEEIYSDDDWTCENCGSMPLCWLSTKPETIKRIKPRKPKAIKMSKATTVDYSELKSLPNCELWTKKNIPFDHERIDVRAHILIFNNGEEARKYCFNTYNGTLGKKQKKLYVEEFINNTPVEAKRLWFALDSKAKTVQKLIKEGYEQE